MYGLENLKPVITVTDTKANCPVRGCAKLVERQSKFFRRSPQFLCKEHGIYISPSTFEYEDERDNLLWCDASDLALLQAIKKEKRECRMARDNSEDAITWNVFRFFEKTDGLQDFLSALLAEHQSQPKLVYWSYSAEHDTVWPYLACARSAFGERDNRGSEPDLIIETSEAVIWIEAKLGALNRTSPRNKLESLPTYQTRANDWFNKVFRSNPEAIAVTDRLYELMRFWLLGTWIADQHGRAFHLISLLLHGREEDLENRLGKHIVAGKKRRFSRVTWEQVYELIRSRIPMGPERKRLLHYFESKSHGYRMGQLQAAFSVRHPRFY